MSAEIRFENVKSVAFDPGRWSVGITVTTTDGTEHKLVASADTAATNGDGIWFGTAEEYGEVPW